MCRKTVERKERQRWDGGGESGGRAVHSAKRVEGGEQISGLIFAVIDTNGFFLVHLGSCA